MRPEDAWILLDAGNVLIGFDHSAISAGLVRACFPPDRQTAAIRTALDRFILSTDDGFCRNAELDHGRRELDWLRTEVCRRFAIDIDDTAFAEAWCSIFHSTPNAEVVRCAAEWRQRGLKVAVCSNTNRVHWQFLLAHHAELRQLSTEVPCFLSFEIGCGKTDPRFYAHVIESTGAARHHHLLVDDRAENRAAAASAGLRVATFDPADVPGSVQRLVSIVDAQLVR